MIVYDLACSRGHRFEGWFASGGDFERQRASALIRCPVCDDSEITRQPSARVAVSRHSQPASAEATTTEQTASGTPPGEGMVAGLPTALVEKLREIVRSAENVGRRFPEEARKIHYNEAPARAIRGRASKEEADALREEGIDFDSLPPFLTGETH